jgi:vacuolar-type H+-ATPase subunit H
VLGNASTNASKQSFLDLDCPVLFSYNSAACLKIFPHEAHILMNDQNIQAVLKLEIKARSVYDAAVREAEQLPVQAEHESQAFIEKARIDTQNGARELISKAEAKEDASRIMAEADEKARQMEAAAMMNLDKAVAYVLKQVIKRE